MTDWQISEEQRAHWPDGVSGNTINGLGEAEPRRPTMVYWPNDGARRAGAAMGDGSTHVFGGLIQWFRRQTPAVRHVYTDFANRAPAELDPVAPQRAEDTPGGWTARAKEYALADEADLVGVARLDPQWFFDDAEPPDLPWVIVLGARMDYERMQHMPPTDADPTSAIEVGEVYNQVDRAAGRLANWIRGQGWYAENQGGPSSGQMLLIPPALACGFGELGRHGSIINRELGSLLRLSAVRTDLPLVPDAPDDLGVEDFCAGCEVCTRACPPGAITGEKQLVRGVRKWYVDFDKCVPYFNEHYACGICLAVCPWSRPGAAPRLAEKFLRRRARRTASGARTYE